MSLSVTNFTHCDFLFFLPLSDAPPPPRHPSTFMPALPMHCCNTLHFVTLWQHVHIACACRLVRVRKYEPFYSAASNVQYVRYITGTAGEGTACFSELYLVSLRTAPGDTHTHTHTLRYREAYYCSTEPHPDLSGHFHFLQQFAGWVIGKANRCYSCTMYCTVPLAYFPLSNSDTAHT